MPSDVQQHERRVGAEPLVAPRGRRVSEPPGDNAATVRRLGVLLTAAAVALLSLMHAVNAVAFGGDVDVLDANEEGTPATWASSVAVFGAALAAALLALALPSRRRLFGWLAAILAFLSLDDVAQLHERLNRFGEAWTVYAMPLLALTLLLLWRASGLLLRPDGRLIHIGLALLVLAVMMETLQRLWLDGYGEGSLVWELDTGIEEAAELAGWGLVATALLATLCVPYRALTGRALARASERS